MKKITDIIREKYKGVVSIYSLTRFKKYTKKEYPPLSSLGSIIFTT